MIVRTNYFNKLINLKDKEIINWNNGGNKHWLFTGFNSFNTQSENDTFFDYFYKKYNTYKYATTSDWKYWNASKSSYVYYNGMKCYKATLSF